MLPVSESAGAQTPGPGALTRAVSAYRVNSSRIAAALLVITNAIPLIGVLWLGWDIMLILALYWAENGVVGVINVGKILLAEGPPPANFSWRVNGRPATSLSRTGTAGFFCVHYGIFWVVHGIFIFTFVPVMAGMGSFIGEGFPFGGVDMAAFGAGVAALAVSHGVSFWMNYIGRREYRSISPAEVMVQPYGRLVILHLTIILGAFISIRLGSPIGSLIVLVVGKTALDLALHLREHRAQGAGPG